MKAFKIVTSLLLALVFATIGANVIGSVLDIKPVYVFCGLAAANFIPSMPGVLNMLAFVAPGGIGTPFLANLNYLPAFLHWNDAGNPITALVVTTDKESTLHEFDANTIAAMRGYMHTGALAANDQNVMLASGHLVRQCTIRGTTAAVGAINFFSSSDNKQSDNKPAVPYRSNAVTAVALTPTMFSNFTALFIPTMAAGDYIDVEFIDGHIQRLEREDLAAWSTFYQEVAGFILNNKDSYIHRASVRCAANTPVYVLSCYIKGQ